MGYSLSEQATINFYEWQSRGCGYLFFNTPVHLEPPYIPFVKSKNLPEEYVDDGRSSSIFHSLVDIFSDEEKKSVEQEPLSLLPKRILHAQDRIGFSLSFPEQTEISSVLSTDFLNMLAFCNESISFEIYAHAENVRIQWTCSPNDRERLYSQLLAYFPNAVFRDIDIHDLDFDVERDVGIADYGVAEEFIRPIYTPQSFSHDPLTSLVGVMEQLGRDDVMLFQVLFSGAKYPWVSDIHYAVSDGRGDGFFENSPEMLICGKEKTSSPLFAVVLRTVVQGHSKKRSQYLTSQMAQSISSISRSEYNSLIPLSNEGYKYKDHLANVFNRSSNRLGMILNSHELVSFVHYPNKSIVSEKLHPQKNKTKTLPKECIGQKYVLGINEHNGVIHTASINEETFGKHIVIGGSTGTGKTHLLKQFISQDLELENTAFVIDAHGDLVQDILLTIPSSKKDKVVFINIADEDFSFGFNIFSANSDAEKTVLASDLASAFADTWISTGDRIQSVLQKTLSTLIYSGKEASLLDMKRFLLEQKFRNEFLSLLDDPVLLYYWHNEFPLVRRNELSPLMLRIDAFMQTRLLRNIFAQARGIDFNALVEGKKLVLFQLSVGLIGLENSKFLAKLLIAKINQIAFARQSLTREQRHPIHLYIDEANHYANTSAIEQILSGARKYNLSLVFVLQHLEQVHTNILNSILTNTATQIFFRQSEKDGKRVAPSFSFFEPIDFMELDVGEALVRVNKRSNDFSLKTNPLVNDIPLDEAHSNRAYIIENTRKKYAKPIEEIQILLNSLLPNHQKTEPKKEPATTEQSKVEIPKKTVSEKPPALETEMVETPIVEPSKIEKQKEDYLSQRKERETVKRHRYLQEYIQQLAQQRGFKTTLEKQTKDGGRIDLVLEYNDISLAIEVAITNSLDYEVQNMQKCITDGFQRIWLISDSKVHLANIKKCLQKQVKGNVFNTIEFIQSDFIVEHLDTLLGTTQTKTERIHGYRVTTSFTENGSLSSEDKQHEITDMILESMRKKKKK